MGGGGGVMASLLTSPGQRPGRWLYAHAHGGCGYVSGDWLIVFMIRHQGGNRGR